MAAKFKVTVFDSRISALFDPGYPANNFARDVNRETLRLADLYVPKRSNELRAGHRNFGVLKAGRYQARGTVGNVTPYAPFVHEGTIGQRIVPLNSRAMPVPRVAGGLPRRRGGTNLMYVGPGLRKESVAGQEGYPWLAIAGEQGVIRVRAHYDILRGRGSV